jgi:endo-1,3-1,4-beta-glycanase ExoK
MRHHLYITLGLGLFSAAGTAEAAPTLNGGELYSTETVRYGRWEIRMQVAATPGSVSTFFTYYNNSYMGLPEPWREIDIEVLGKEAKGFQSNLLTGHAAQRITSEAFHTTADDLTKGFHTYVLDWTPDSVVFRLDGKTVRKTPGTDPQMADLGDRAQSYRMNLWASTEPAWVGALDESKLPVVQTVNWMVYSAYTPGQGPNGSDFTPRWTDDFTSLNTSRWSRANWTFDGNMADFVPDNIRVSNGYLMLILSKKGWTGNPTPPADPVGNSYTVSVAPRIAAPRIRTEASPGRLRVFAGERPVPVVVAASDGRILARRYGAGPLEFKDLPKGILHVRTPAGASMVLMP